MTDPAGALRRILFALDAATHQPPSIQAVVELAARLEAELIGLFVEDAELLRAADLRIARRVSFLTAEEEVFDVAATERELRGVASATRRCLAQAAERSKVKWSFRVVRGETVRAISEAAADVDFLVLCCAARPLGAHARLRAPTHAAADAIDTSVLVLPPAARLAGPVCAAVDAAASAAAADDVLRAAVTLASALAQPRLTVLLLGDRSALPALRARAADLAAAAGVAVDCRALPTDPTALRGELAGAGLLVVGALGASAQCDELRAVAERLDRPVLTVRRRH